MGNIKEGQKMEEINILELLEQMKNDESWCPDANTRAALVNRMIFFIIEN
jgi:hypothetical protein